MFDKNKLKEELKKLNSADALKIWDVIDKHVPHVQGMCMKKARNIKNGKTYTLINTEGTDATNSRDGQEVFAYIDDNGRLFVREISEFGMKFEQVS